MISSASVARSGIKLTPALAYHQQFFVSLQLNETYLESAWPVPIISPVPMALPTAEHVSLTVQGSR